MTKFFYKTYKNWKNTATNNCNILPFENGILRQIWQFDKIFNTLKLFEFLFRKFDFLFNLQ
jgi:hypothetical protein